VPGVVRRLRFADPDTRGTWKSAFPARDGDLLNLRDLEQGLEQMKRVASQDVDMKIEPTDTPGESDIVLNVKHSKPWTFVVSADNSGTDATGKWQGNVSLGIDNPLGLNDVFTVGANQDLSFGNTARLPIARAFTAWAQRATRTRTCMTRPRRAKHTRRICTK
jgi:hemolysin activation/secretion protein